jgi:hypothetical protein
MKLIRAPAGSESLILFSACNSDIRIARGQEPKDVSQLAEEIGLYPNEVFQYGHKKAKIGLSVLKRLEHQKSGKYIVVAGYVLYFYIKQLFLKVKYTLITVTTAININVTATVYIFLLVCCAVTVNFFLHLLHTRF